ncbi:superoxide dismutase family protein [Pseudalkalibacillus sp. SCS-8]|uniref:superoxide dismutase family protein n=1 Tax=Pseudalkalibacillus nanhaiensis TaxID=3115291 RepID=UPI0032D9D173
MKRSLWIFFLVMFVVLLAACGSDTSDDAQNDEENPSLSGNENEGNVKDEVVPISVDLKNSDGDNIGTVDLEQQFEGVKITVEASNLSPGKHGFHIHEKGVCEAPDFKSAGGHFNPDDVSHGTEHGEEAHAGDLPNLSVDENGEVQEEFVAEKVTLKSGEPNSLIGSNGTAFIIHKKADDNKSQPSGDAGDRVACGVISEMK